MTVGVVRASRPFERSVHDDTAERLVAAFNERGHGSELVRVPYGFANVEMMLNSMLSTATMRVRGVDRLIVTGFPVSYVRHTSRVGWILEDFEPAELVLRQAVANIDARELSAMPLFAATPALQAGLRQRSGLTATVLAPPQAGDTAGWDAVVQALIA
ncbi:MAG: hypothetical protein JO199_05365 [Candidatus Eremiobacteraeota bacterium]|nr:hypothetical protein [Candidatus Eremiobacteraeota bacterium]